MKNRQSRHRDTEERIRIIKAVPWWSMTVFYMGLIFYLSSLSSLPFVRITSGFDKAVHLAAYVPLAFLMYHAMVKSGLRKYAFVAAFAVACLYGITDEFHQSAVPGRDAAVGDLMADSVGAFLGSLAGSRSTNRERGLRESSR